MLQYAFRILLRFYDGIVVLLVNNDDDENLTGRARMSRSSVVHFW